jgi:DNA-binding response OmpR family regulator
MRLLLIEDDPLFGRTLEDQLNKAGFVVDRVVTGQNAEAAVATSPYPLAILDRRLPDGDSVARIAALRRFRPDLRIIVLTALDATPEKIEGLNAGADDYLAKPIDPDELVARVRAALRRPGGTLQPVIVCANLRYDPAIREFRICGKPVFLKRRELMILETLIIRVRRVVQRQTFMDSVYGFNEEVQSNTLEAHISRLRTKLAQLGAGVVIHPVRGVGYMLTIPLRAPARRSGCGADLRNPPRDVPLPASRTLRQLQRYCRGHLSRENRSGDQARSIGGPRDHDDPRSRAVCCG